MKKLLFVNACIRENSRTEQLCRRYLNQLAGEYQIEELKATSLAIKPFDAEMLKQRDYDIANNQLDLEPYHLARQFAAADRIVIAAPYWDFLFPAVLRTYFEHICVLGITFAYSEKGQPVKLCQADTMTYITTCGGFLPEHAAVESVIREMGALFAIECVEFYAAEGLDIYPEQVPAILNQTAEQWQADDLR